MSDYTCTRTHPAHYDVAADGTVEALVMPWMVPTDVADYVGGRLLPYREQFARGSFARAEAAPTRVRFCWGHSDLIGNDLGKGVRFYDTTEGEVAVFHLDEPSREVARSKLDGMGVSVHFAPMKPSGIPPAGAMVTRESVHVIHVAAVSSPAYEDARVLAIREADEAARLVTEQARADEARMAAFLRSQVDLGVSLAPDHAAWLEARLQSLSTDTPPA